MGKIQKQDVKTVTELVNAGASAADLPNDDQVYVTAQGINKTLKDAITDGNIGASGSGVNYLSDANANDLSKFVLYNDGGAVPTDGIGGSVNSNLTKSLNTGTPIIGTSSFRISKSGAVDLQGHGFSITTDKTLDAPVTAGEPVTIQFRYRTSANYASGQIKMFVFFVGPNVVQALNGVTSTGVFTNDLQAQTGNRGQFTATTSCPSGTTAIRLIGHIAGTATTNYDIDIDEINIGTATTLTSPVVTDWVSYTPTLLTGSGTITNFTTQGRWRRVGENIELAGAIIFTGSPGTWGSGLFVSYPAGLSPDFSKMPIISGAGVLRNGTSFFASSSVTCYGTLVAGQGLANSSTHFAFNPFVVNTADTGSGDDPVLNFGATNVSNTGPVTLASGSRIEWSSFKIPITQFAGGTNVISSTQANFISGAFRASRNGVTQSGINPNNTYVKINFNSVSHSKDYVIGGFTYDTTNSRFVARKDMNLIITARVNIEPTNVLNSQYLLTIFKNGTDLLIAGQPFVPAASTTLNLFLSGNARLKAQEYIEVFLIGVGNNSVNTLTLSSNTDFNYFSAAEIPDLSVVGISGAPEELIEVNGTFTPNTSSWVVSSSSLSIPPGSWDVEGIFLSDNAAAASTQGVRYNLSTGASTSASEDYVFTNGGFAVSNVATNNLRGGSAIISGFIRTATTISLNAKAICYNANFTNAVLWRILARRRR